MRSKEPYATTDCSVCGVRFTYLKSAYSGKYCSRKCKHEGLKKPDSWATRTCAKCGKTFTTRSGLSGNKKYCSLGCYGRTRNRTPLSCQICGKSFEAIPSRLEKARFCSVDCQVEWQRRQGVQKIRPDTSWYGSKLWRAIRKNILNRDGYECQGCGSRYFLHVHHIEPWSISHDNSATNLVTLCASCHRLTDMRLQNHQKHLAMESYDAR